MNAPQPDQSPSAAACADGDSVIAHKFGGSSVADASRYRHVAICRVLHSKQGAE